MSKRKRNDSEYRNSLRKNAKNKGMSTKSYLASRWDSVGWNYAIEVIRRRCKRNNVECDITAKDLKQLWEEQNGICSLTGWEMTKRKTQQGLTMTTVTVDRINQIKGYVIGNIRLVCFAANNARYNWSDDEFIKLCQSIVTHVAVRP